MSVER